MPLTDPDEVFYAETAKEMQIRNEFLTPYIFGKPQFEKPPLYYWLVIFSFKAFGVNEFAARVPSAVFGILGVIGMYLLGKILINRRSGFLAAIILATGIEYLILARACVTDIVLAVFILYAFLFFFYGRKWYLLSAVSLGLAVLTKGPIGIFLPVIIIIVYLIFTKELKKLREIPFAGGALVFLAVTLPWYLLAYRAHGAVFIDEFFGFHNVIRFLHPEHKSGDVFYYYVPVIIGGFFPWSIFLPLGIGQVFREAKEKLKKTNIFLLSWILIILIFFSISRTKLPTYVFPLYPALALLLGRLSDVFLDGGFAGSRKKALNVSVFLFFLVIAGGFIGLSVIAREKYPTLVTASLVTGGAFLAFMGAFFAALRKRKYVLGITLCMLSFIIFISLSSFFVFPEIGKYEASRHVSEKLMGFMRPGEKIGAETQYRRGVSFYTGKEDILDVHPHHIITRFLDEKERVWCVIKEKNYDQLYDDVKEPYGTRSYVVYKFGKKVIITNKIPRDGKFIRMRGKNVSG